MTAPTAATVADLGVEATEADVEQIRRSTPPRPGYYLHFKGGVYLVHGTIRDANNDGLPTVHYSPLAPNGLPGDPWVRKVEDFNEPLLLVSGDTVRRFEYLADRADNQAVRQALYAYAHRAQPTSERQR